MREINDEGHCQGRGRCEKSGGAAIDGNYPSLAQTSITRRRYRDPVQLSAEDHERLRLGDLENVVNRSSIT